MKKPEFKVFEVMQHIKLLNKIQLQKNKRIDEELEPKIRELINAKQKL